MMPPMTIEGLLAPRMGRANIQAPVNMPLTADEPQQAMGGGVWGQGGQLITPEQAKDRRSRAYGMMEVDASPIYSPWQGLARVLNGMTGAFEARNVRKAEERTAEHNKQLMAQLSSGMSGGADGSSPTSAPNIEAILLDRYASPEAKAYAGNVQKQRQAREMKQYEADLKNRETVWEDNFGNRWRNQASGQPEAAPFWVDNTPKFDSQVVTDQATGVQTLVRTPMVNPYGQPQAPQGLPAIGEEVDDPRGPQPVPANHMQAGEDAAMAGLNNGGILTPAQAQAIRSALGTAADSYMRAHNMRVQ